MKKLHLLLISAALTIQNVSAQDDKGIFIDPATVSYHLSSGESAVERVSILNRMDKKMQFKLYLNDWERDTMGRHKYILPGTHPNSCSRWVSIDRDFVELGPGEKAFVNVKIAMPDSAVSAKSMRWSMLFIETVEEKKTASKTTGVTTTIQTNYRVGVHIYQTPPVVTNKEMRMTAFAPLAGTADSVYRMVCQNVGDVQLQCKGAIELVNLSSGEKVKLNPLEFPLFPSQKRFVDFTLPSSLAKGKYTVLATIDSGEDMPLEAAEATIEIK